MWVWGRGKEGGKGKGWGEQASRCDADQPISGTNPRLLHVCFLRIVRGGGGGWGVCDTSVWRISYGRAVCGRVMLGSRFVMLPLERSTVVEQLRVSHATRCPVFLYLFYLGTFSEKPKNKTMSFEEKPVFFTLWYRTPGTCDRRRFYPFAREMENRTSLFFVPREYHAARLLLPSVLWLVFWSGAGETISISRKLLGV